MACSTHTPSGGCTVRQRARATQLDLVPPNPPPARSPARPLMRECGSSICAALTSIHRLGQ
eukprot:3874102-Prymnesium_polylepis.1